jgi:transposase
MRLIGLDVHRDFCQVAIAEAGVARTAGRVPTEPPALLLFAQSLGADDEVALEATGNALGIARIVEPHVGSGRVGEPEGGQGDHPGRREDGQDRRANAGEAARRRLSAVALLA